MSPLASPQRDDGCQLHLQEPESEGHAVPQLPPHRDGGDGLLHWEVSQQVADWWITNTCSLRNLGLWKMSKSPKSFAGVTSAAGFLRVGKLLQRWSSLHVLTFCSCMPWVPSAHSVQSFCPFCRLRPFPQARPRPPAPRHYQAVQGQHGHQGLQGHKGQMGTQGHQGQTLALGHYRMGELPQDPPLPGVGHTGAQEGHAERGRYSRGLYQHSVWSCQ